MWPREIILIFVDDRQSIRPCHYTKINTARHDKTLTVEEVYDSKIYHAIACSAFQSFLKQTAGREDEKTV